MTPPLPNLGRFVEGTDVPFGSPDLNLGALLGDIEVGKV